MLLKLFALFEQFTHIELKKMYLQNKINTKYYFVINLGKTLLLN